jgi:hypothetical protein
MISFGLVMAAIRLLMAFGLVNLQGHWLAGFTAIAHVYMGILLHCWWVSRVKFAYVRDQFHSDDHGSSVVWIAWIANQPWQWNFLWFMNFVEVFSVIVSRS